MRIGELASRSGIPTSTIRYYEAEGVLRPPARRSSRRIYDESAVTELAVVLLARRTGFTLAEIRQLVREFGRERWRGQAERKLEQIRETSAELAAMAALLEELIGCECPDLEACGRILRREERRRRSRRTPAGRKIERRRIPPRLSLSRPSAG